VFRWHNSFLEGQEYVEIILVREKLQQQKRTAVLKVRALVKSDRVLTLRMSSSDLILNRFNVHQTMTLE
jgi:hypothetical protein